MQVNTQTHKHPHTVKEEFTNCFIVSEFITRELVNLVGELEIGGKKSH